MKLISLIVGIIALPIVGIRYLFFAENIQKSHIERMEQGKALNLLNKHVRSKAYLIKTRAIGVVMLIMFTLLLWMLIKNWPLF